MIIILPKWSLCRSLPSIDCCQSSIGILRRTRQLCFLLKEQGRPQGNENLPIKSSEVGAVLLKIWVYSLQQIPRRISIQSWKVEPFQSNISPLCMKIRGGNHPALNFWKLEPVVSNQLFQTFKFISYWRLPCKNFKRSFYHKRTHLSSRCLQRHGLDQNLPPINHLTTDGPQGSVVRTHIYPEASTRIKLKHVTMKSRKWLCSCSISRKQCNPTPNIREGRQLDGGPWRPMRPTRPIPRAGGLDKTQSRGSKLRGDMFSKCKEAR